MPPVKRTDDEVAQGITPHLPVEDFPPVTEPVAPPPSEELRSEIARIQSEEQLRIDREEQAKLARLREQARFD